MASVKVQHWLVLLLLLGCASGCQVTSDPPRARIEAALPGLLEQVAQMRVYGPARGSPVGAGLRPAPTEEALRIAMASCVRFYCTPDEQQVLERMEASSGMVLDFQSPQDMPTALPLPGWFGPLRGYEEMEGVERLCIILEEEQWVEVIARHTGGTWSCWKSNWEIEG